MLTYGNSCNLAVVYIEIGENSTMNSLDLVATFSDYIGFRSGE